MGKQLVPFAGLFPGLTAKKRFDDYLRTVQDALGKQAVSQSPAHRHGGSSQLVDSLGVFREKSLAGHPYGPDPRQAHLSAVGMARQHHLYAGSAVFGELLRPVA